MRLYLILLKYWGCLFKDRYLKTNSRCTKVLWYWFKKKIVIFFIPFWLNVSSAATCAIFWEKKATKKRGKKEKKRKILYTTTEKNRLTNYPFIIPIFDLHIPMRQVYITNAGCKEEQKILGKEANKSDRDFFLCLLTIVIPSICWLVSNKGGLGYIRKGGGGHKTAGGKTLLADQTEKQKSLHSIIITAVRWPIIK